MDNFIVREAKIADAKSIHSLLIACTVKGKILPMSLSQVYYRLRQFFVICEKNPDGSESFVGCGALSVFWDDLAELRSLAITQEKTRKGFGSALVNAIVTKAMELGLKKVFVLTARVEFFEKLGFHIVPKEQLPQKIWNDCVDCPLFPNCTETAMIKVLE